MILISSDSTCHVEDHESIYGRVFNKVMNFHDGVAAVSDESGAYHIGLDGREIYSKRFQKAFGYYEGLAAVSDESGAFHIDLHGKDAYNQRFLWTGNYQDGHCAVRTKEGDYGLIDHKGSLRFRGYGYVGDCSEGYSIVRSVKGSAHADMDGSIILEKWHTDCTNFCNGIAYVNDGEGYYPIDKNGKRLGSPVFSRVVAFTKGRLTAIDLDGNLVDYGKVTMGVGSSVNCQQQLPSWVKVVKNHRWDSCAVFMRHSIRDANYRSDNCRNHSESLNAEGVAFSKKIGKAILDIGIKELAIHSSPMPRCIETSEFILDTSGFDNPIDVTDVLGLPGTAFIYDNKGSDETNKYPLMENAIRSLEGKDVKGWYSPWISANKILDFLSDDLRVDGRLTLCISHDAFVARLSGVLGGVYHADRWFDYCEGVIILRKGDTLYTEIDGQLVRVPDLDKKECKIIDRPSDTIVRVIEGTEGISTFIDENGKYGFIEEHDMPISSDRFDYAGEMKYSRAVVGIDGKGFTFLNDMGEYLVRRWFRECSPYHKGFAIVRDDHGWYHIDERGNRIYDGYFRVAEPFYNDVSRCVDDDGDTILVSTDGTREAILGGERFD